MSCSASSGSVYAYVLSFLIPITLDILIIKVVIESSVLSCEVLTIIETQVELFHSF